MEKKLSKEGEQNWRDCQGIMFSSARGRLVAINLLCDSECDKQRSGTTIKISESLRTCEAIHMNCGCYV